ncbi:MAG: hypothetical protein E4H36_14535 [Spirochaetales bacterium]|nr:MAG: hypothetical protein E4H36_14535 [Spirochaetales bacterium]
MVQANEQWIDAMKMGYFFGIILIFSLIIDSGKSAEDFPGTLNIVPPFNIVICFSANNQSVSAFTILT